MITENVEYLVGADEVGYGAFAGPLCVAAVLAPVKWHLEGLNDSKKLSKKKREELSDKLWELNDQGEIVIFDLFGSNKEIDNEGLGVVQRRLLTSAINACVRIFKNESNICAIVDGNLTLDQEKLLVPYKSIIKADGQVPAVMAASIIAKVARDDYMRSQEIIYPGYDFANNVGYGTTKHQAGLKALGVSEIHRFSYKPIKEIYEASKRG